MSYSPDSPYARMYTSSPVRSLRRASLALKGRGTSSEKLRCTLTTIGVVFLVLSMFFTHLRTKHFTQVELSGSWSTLSSTIEFYKSDRGMYLLVFMWIVALGLLITSGYGYYHSRK